MPKIIERDGPGLRVLETVAPGKERGWTFNTLADAARQRGEFESALSAAQKTELDLTAAAETAKER